MNILKREEVAYLEDEVYGIPRRSCDFLDFSEKYGFDDMYSGGFYPYPKQEIFWAYWARYIYINRYMDTPKYTYQKLYEMVKDKDYFVITTNVDHFTHRAIMVCFKALILILGRHLTMKSG